MIGYVLCKSFQNNRKQLRSGSLLKNPKVRHKNEVNGFRVLQNKMATLPGKSREYVGRVTRDVISYDAHASFCVGDDGCIL